MRRAIKNRGKIVQAYKLGNDSQPVIRELIERGKIKVLENGTYQVFSREAVHGKGQEAQAGCYLRIDSEGNLYPNSPEFAAENLRHISGDNYEQIPRPVYIWTAKDGMCKEIEFLMKQKNLVINEQSYEKFYTAPLWGTLLSANKDAYVVFYHLEKDGEGSIVDAEYNFVEYNEFHKTYHIIS